MSSLTRVRISTRLVLTRVAATRPGCGVVFPASGEGVCPRAERAVRETTTSATAVRNVPAPWQTHWGLLSGQPPLRSRIPRSVDRRTSPPLSRSTLVLMSVFLVVMRDERCRPPRASILFLLLPDELQRAAGRRRDQSSARGHTSGRPGRYTHSNTMRQRIISQRAQLAGHGAGLPLRAPLIMTRTQSARVGEARGHCMGRIGRAMVKLSSRKLSLEWRSNDGYLAT